MDERGNKRFGLLISLTPTVAFYTFASIFSENESFSSKKNQDNFEQIGLIFLHY